MALTRIGAVAAHFGRDVERTLAKLEAMLDGARRDGVDLLVLPGATLGGYVPDLQFPWTAGPTRAAGVQDLPPAFALDAEVVRRVCALAGDLVVCFGFCELEDGLRYNTAVCVTGDGVLGPAPQGPPAARGVRGVRGRATASPPSTPRSGGWGC